MISVTEITTTAILITVIIETTTLKIATVITEIQNSIGLIIETRAAAIPIIITTEIHIIPKTITVVQNIGAITTGPTYQSITITAIELDFRRIIVTIIIILDFH